MFRRILFKIYPIDLKDGKLTIKVKITKIGYLYFFTIVIFSLIFNKIKESVK